MPAIIKAVIFDLDGVIINSNPAIEAFWKSWTDREGIEMTDEKVRQWIHGRKVGDTITGLFNHLSDKMKEQIREDAYHFDSRMSPGPIDGVLDFVKSLHMNAIPVGIVTSSHFERMEIMIRNISADHLFTHFVTAHDVSQGKPHPEPYTKMSEKLQIEPNNCLVFEDAVSGIQSATAAEMYSIGIGHETAKTDLMQNGAADVIPDFTGISFHQKNLVTVNGFVFNT